MANPTWPDILRDLKGLKQEVAEQNFWIDVSYKLNRLLKSKTAHRQDLNVPAIATYWGHELLQHYILNNLDLKLRAVFFELEYYSYLNLDDFKKAMEAGAEQVYIIDLISDSTDVKTGEDLEEWFEGNSPFTDALKEMWNNEILEVWLKEDKLVTTKKANVNLERYWNYEDFIYKLTIMDQELNTKIIFLLGTYMDYKK